MFFLDHEVILERPFRVWAIYVFTLPAYFLLLFQPLSRFRHLVKPRALVVFITGHRIHRLDVSKLIGITVFEGETVSHSLFRSPETPLLSKFCSHHAKTAILWIFHPSPLRPPRQIQQSVITWWKCCFRTSSQNISPLCWHPCLSFVILLILLLIFNVFPPPPPPPPHFYCFRSSPSSSSFFIVFRPPPPPPHFSWFSSTTTTTTTFLIYRFSQG